MNSKSSKSIDLRPGSLTILSLVGLTLLARFIVPVIAPEWWGLNHLKFTPQFYTLSVLGLMIVMVVLARWELRFFAVVSQKVWWRESGPFVFISALILACFLGAVSTDTHIFGQGYERLGNLAHRPVSYIHPLEYLATWIPVFLFQQLPALTVKPLFDAAIVSQTISVLCGTATILIIRRVSILLSSDSFQRSIIFTSGLLMGALILFAGSVEYHAPMAFIIALYTLGLCKLTLPQTQSTKVWNSLSIILLTILAPLFLAQLIILTPVTIYVILTTFFPARRIQKVFLGLFVISLVIFVALIYSLREESLWIDLRVLGAFSQAPEFDYGVFTLRRVFDIVSSGFVLFPFLPVTIYLLYKGRKLISADRFATCVMALSSAGLVWAIISDYPGGAARQVLSLAPFALPPSLLAGYVWAKLSAGESFDRFTKRVTLSLMFGSLALVAPVYLSGDTAVSYLSYDYTENRPARYLSGLFGFRDHYFYKRNFAEADKWEARFKSLAPEYLDHETVKTLFSRDDISAADNRLSFLITTHPHWSALRASRAATLQSSGKLNKALESIDAALDLDPANVTNLLTKSEILRLLKNEVECREVIDRAIHFDPLSADSRYRSGLSYYRDDDLDRAESEALMIYEINFADVRSFFLRGLVQERRGDRKGALKYFSYFEKHGKKLPEYSYAKSAVERLR